MAAQTAERRPLGALGRMSVVAAIHVAAFIVIVKGLAFVPGSALIPIQGVKVEDTRPPPDEPPPPDYKVEHTDTVTLPPPEFFPLPPDASNDTIVAEFVPPEKLSDNVGSAVAVPVLVGARPDPRRPLSQPIYPSQLIRENAEGFVDVEVFVQPDGRVGDARIVKTSGYEAFDRNTLDEAKRRWRLVPATRDGVAVPQWYRLRVVFKLKNQ